MITDPATQIKEIDPYTVSFTVAKPGYGFTLLSLLANVTGYIYDSKLLRAMRQPQTRTPCSGARTIRTSATGPTT